MRVALPKKKQNEGQLNLLRILITNKTKKKHKIVCYSCQGMCWRGSKNVYLTDPVDAHISAFVALVAWCAVGDGVAHLFGEVFIEGAAVQLTGAGCGGQTELH